MLAIVAIIVGLVGLGVGFAVGFVLRRNAQNTSLQESETTARRVLDEAESERTDLIRTAQDDVLELRKDAESELRERRTEINRLEQRLDQREQNLDRKHDAADERDEALRDRERDFDSLREEFEASRQEHIHEVERISGLTREEARHELLESVDDEVRDEANRRVREMDEQVAATASVRAQKVLATAIQRYTSEVSFQSTVTVVPITSEDMKGRIIGREGRNIRAIEAATGVDLIIDDTPDAITVSSFDPVRREVARMAVSALVQDGRIHPTRIEEAVSRARRDVEATMAESAEGAASEAGVPSLHPEVMKVFGRLRFRTSYGQNVMKHSVETAHIAAMIAEEIGADVVTARAGGFLHDLGKAVDHEVEGTHAIIGAGIARRHRIKDAVAHCIEAHHEEVEPTTVEAVIVQMADAISGGRPGARAESVENYIKRLETLEQIATDQQGVDSAYAIQAGRELRIIVKPDKVDDFEAMRIARDVSQQIEETMEYPGQIKVTVVRETRASEIAR